MIWAEDKSPVFQTKEYQDGNALISFMSFLIQLIQR